MALFNRHYRLLIGQPSTGAPNSTNTDLAQARNREADLLARAKRFDLSPEEQSSIEDALRSERENVARLTDKKDRERTGVEITDLRVKFDITKTRSKTPNTNKIMIYNLKPSTRALIEKPNTRCMFYAGYAEHSEPMLLFSGAVAYAYTTFEEGDVITYCLLGDGSKEIRDSVVSLSYGPGSSSEAMIRDVARQMGLSLSLSQDVNTRTWANGMSFHGPARSALTKIMAGSGNEWSIQNGVIQVVRSGGSTTRQAIVIAADSGLIGAPERERQGAQQTATVRDRQTNENRRLTSATQDKDGWRVKTLLMPMINPADRVVLNSRSVSASLLCDEIKHHGDSHEGDWQSDIKLVAALTPIKPAKGKANG